MQTFEVDDEVREAVWRQAGVKPFDNITFNEALRKILDLSDAEVSDAAAAAAELQEVTSSVAGENQESKNSTGSVSAALPRPQRAAKADLAKLVSEGLLQENQELYLVDYRGNRVPGYKAAVSGRFLKFSGGHHSMSALARELLKRQGFQSHQVRGPAHWETSSGVRVSELWSKHLAEVR